METGRRARLYVEDDLGRGRAVALDADRAHYLGHVLRAASGAPVLLFNGRDGEWAGRIERLAKRTATVTVEERLRAQDDGADLWLAFAPLKRFSIDLLAEKATELGVSALWPILTERTQVARVNLARLAANVVEAAQQSGRLTVPRVLEPARLPAALARWPAGRRLILCDESGAAPPVAQALGALEPGAARAPWAVMVGPEGGFAPSELDALRDLPFVTPVGLGPRLLRAETAALAALACWQSLVGEWRPRAVEPRPR